MSLVQIHAGLSNACLLFSLIVAGYGFLRYFRQQGVDGGFFGVIVVGELLYIAQVVVGVLRKSAAHDNDVTGRHPHGQHEHHAAARHQQKMVLALVCLRKLRAVGASVEVDVRAVCAPEITERSTVRVCC